ncbi:hypothetical protein BU251_02370 [Candidatus Velamenicoccus archaeovorus]|uniref:Lipoprotein n=1 Tax=Velamenicoccus archaeovorus TaxID=1930593 RepID=A0A410P3T0_VELA1|nr:DUF3313 family protein [Candidatus Velamenicoccus archaeovorus]QAT16654.1 hypothetical protein BU251_02370 [Candidatus Velamenicoccus archaeovorus]
MKNLCWVLLGTAFLAGCAANKVYVNPEKTIREMTLDETECRTVADASDLQDDAGRKKEYDRCMQQRGYRLVAEKNARRVKGFKEVWVDPLVDFKVYEAIVIDKVDVSEVQVMNMRGTPGTKVSDADIDRLAERMRDRFSVFLGAVLPVVPQEEAGKRKILRIRLSLLDIATTNIGVNIALQAVPVPYMPVSSKGLFSFEGTITDFSSGKKLVTMADKTGSGKNSSLIGLEKFDKWKYAYETIDYWADCLAKFLADKRGEPYKSQLKFKFI